MKLDSNINELQPWVQGYIDRLSPTDRKHLLANVRRKLQSVNKQRMMAQKSPDGEPWAARRHSSIRDKVAGAKITFNYKTRNHTRNVAMKSYRDDGQTLIGYDLFTDRISRFSKSKITNMRKGNKTGIRGRLHSRKMFIGARKRLSSVILNDSIRVGWKGRTARILAHHQFGNAKTAQRELIGITSADKQLLSQVIMDYVEHAR